MNYGKVAVVAVDSIEKKPIFHFRPGSTLLSVGTVGCNLDCQYCQNSQLAKVDVLEVPFTYYSPETLVKEALERGVDGIAWTFNEPVVWAEYLLDVSRLARRRDLYTMVNTNGYIEGGAREDLLRACDVIKVDIKAFRDETYRRVCGGDMQPVLDTCLAASTLGVHLELAYPMIPDVNDSAREMEDLFLWIRGNLGVDVPLHLFRFSPAFRMSHMEREPLVRMRGARVTALNAGLKYVYFGGVVSAEEQNTYCPRCGNLVVSRSGRESDEKVFVKKEQMSRFCPSFSEVGVHLESGRCPRCQEAIKIRFA